MTDFERRTPRPPNAVRNDEGARAQICNSIFFLEGTEDLTTPTELARKYLEAIQTPRKEFVPIYEGHFAVFMNSDQFLKELVAHVLPLAGGH
jgi:hypothetical protein